MYPTQAGYRRHSSILLLLTVAFACCLLLCGCGSSKKGTNAGTGQTSAESAQEMTAEEVQKWINGGTEFTGRRATVAGQVFNIQRDGNTIAYTVNGENDTANLTTVAECATAEKQDTDITFTKTGDDLYAGTYSDNLTFTVSLEDA